MSVILAVETAFPEIDVALSVDGEIRRPRIELAAQRGSALHAAVAELLGEGADEALCLDEIRVDVGPGSYTGLRVGLAFVRTWKLLHPAQVRACYSTDLLARAAKTEVPSGSEFVVVLDARRQQWFGTRYRHEADGLRRLCKPVCLRPPELAAWARHAVVAFSTSSSVPLAIPQHCLASPTAELLLREEQLLWNESEPMPLYLMPPI